MFFMNEKSPLHPPSRCLPRVANLIGILEDAAHLDAGHVKDLALVTNIPAFHFQQIRGLDRQWDDCPVGMDRASADAADLNVPLEVIDPYRSSFLALFGEHLDASIVVFVPTV